MEKTISLEDALQKKTQTEVCDNTERVVLSYTDTEGQNGIKTVPVSYFDKTIKKAMFVSLLNNITNKASHSIYFTEKTTNLNVGSTVTITKDNVREYMHIPDEFYDEYGDEIGSMISGIVVVVNEQYFLFYSKTGDEYVDEFIKTSGIYNYSLDDLSDETIEAFKKCEYGVISFIHEDYCITEDEGEVLPFFTCPIGEFGLQRDNFKEYIIKIKHSESFTIEVKSFEKSCTIQDFML